MSLVFRNALMPSENQQVLRLRLPYLMRRFLLLALGMGLLLPSAAVANEDIFKDSYGESTETGDFGLDRCYAWAIHGAAKKDVYIQARSVRKLCGCVINNKRKGLLIESCSSMKSVDSKKVEKYFQ